MQRAMRGREGSKQVGPDLYEDWRVVHYIGGHQNTSPLASVASVINNWNPRNEFSAVGYPPEIGKLSDTFSQNKIGLLLDGEITAGYTQDAGTT